MIAVPATETSLFYNSQDNGLCPSNNINYDTPLSQTFTTTLKYGKNDFNIKAGIIAHEIAVFFKSAISSAYWNTPSRLKLLLGYLLIRKI